MIPPRTRSTYTKPTSTPQHLNTFSHFRRLPSSSAKEPKGEQPHRGFRNEYTPEYTRMLPPQRDCQKVRQWNLDKPEEHQVDLGRCPRVAGAVERLYRHHPPAVDEEGIRQYSQPFTTDGDNLRIIRENFYQSFVKDKEHHRHPDKEYHIIESNFPHRRFSAIRISRPEVLPYEGGRGIGQSPRRHNGKHHDPNSNRRRGHRLAAYIRQNARKKNPGSHAHDHLTHPTKRSTVDLKHDLPIQANLRQEYFDMLSSFEEYPQLHEYAETTTDSRGYRSALDAHCRN